MHALTVSMKKPKRRELKYLSQDARHKNRIPGGGKEPACQYRRPRFDIWVRKIPGGGNGNPLQYAWLENSVNREAWWAAVHEVSKSRTWLNHWVQKGQQDPTFGFSHLLWFSHWSTSSHGTTWLVGLFHFHRRKPSGRMEKPSFVLHSVYAHHPLFIALSMSLFWKYKGLWEEFRPPSLKGTALALLCAQSYRPSFLLSAPLWLRWDKCT